MAATTSYFSVAQLGDVTVVRLSTSARIVSCDNFPALRDELLNMLRRTGAKKVVLNLDNIEYLHSLAIGFLLKLHQVSIQEGGWLRICHVQSEVKEALVVTQASATLDLRINEESALEEA